MKNIIYQIILGCLLFGTAISLSGKATTTVYCDHGETACGCANKWAMSTFTAAGSDSIFGHGGWCGSGCGKCFKLTSLGYAPDGSGGGRKGDSIIVQVTDECPSGGEWCTVPNKYGFTYHFDLADCNRQISSRGWDNPVVEFIEVPCSAAQSQQYKSCECSKSDFLSDEKPILEPDNNLHYIDQPVDDENSIHTDHIDIIIVDNINIQYGENQN